MSVGGDWMVFGFFESATSGQRNPLTDILTEGWKLPLVKMLTWFFHVPHTDLIVRSRLGRFGILTQGKKA